MRYVFNIRVLFSIRNPRHCVKRRKQSNLDLTLKYFFNIVHLAGDDFSNTAAPGRRSLQLFDIAPPYLILVAQKMACYTDERTPATLLDLTSLLAGSPSRV
jgi:hypothetical protein